MLPMHYLATVKQTDRENVHYLKEKSLRNYTIFECDMHTVSVVLCPVLQNLMTREQLFNKLVRKCQSDLRFQRVKRCPESVLKIIKLSE